MLDACVWSGASDVLIAAGHDVDSAGSRWEDDPGDLEILRAAFAEERVLVTLDKDFGELIVSRGEPHRGIIRLVQIRSMDHGPVAVQALSKYHSELLSGAIVTVEPGRVRIRLSETD